MKTKKEIYDSVAISADALRLVEFSEKAFHNSLGKLVADCVGENQPMVFNDETGFPTFKFDNGDETEDTYVMKACFEFEGIDGRVRVYYGNVTEEIGYVSVDA